MGAVQKLATVVMVGLTALAVLLVVPSQTSGTGGTPKPRSKRTSIERGIGTYVPYCLSATAPPAKAPKGRSPDRCANRRQHRRDHENQSTEPVIREEP